MHKIKAEITTNKGVLKAGIVVDVTKHFKAKELKELEDAGYIERYNEEVEDKANNELEAKVEELTTQIKALASTNEELNAQIVSKDKTIEELEAKVDELSKKATAPKTGAKK